MLVFVTYTDDGQRQQSLTLQGTSEELDMRALVDMESLHVGVDCGIEAGRSEVCLGKVGQSLTVEGIL